MSLIDSNNWFRIVENDTPVYIQPEIPDWFVPNKIADEALQRSESVKDLPVPIQGISTRLHVVPQPHATDRDKKLSLKHLKECWIHISNRCNLACTHCMFKSSPRATEELSDAESSTIIIQALALGCKIFYFTGGEPLMSKAFFKRAEDILKFSDTHVVVLTNGAFFTSKMDKLREMPLDRLHFQVSVDGLEKSHDEIRGKSAYKNLEKNIKAAIDSELLLTLSMVVTKKNVSEMKDVVRFAANHGVFNLHYLWVFNKGNANNDMFIEPEDIFPHLIEAQKVAQLNRVSIDNIEILRSQILSCPGTRYDLSNAGWQSLAVGPDGCIYPTPALVYSEEYKCGHIKEGLENIWHNSAVLNHMRSVSLNSDGENTSPYRYLLGGGDIDHSIIHSGSLVGGDPYIPLYNKIIAWLISEEAALFNTVTHAAIQLKMGDKLGECPLEGAELFFTHSNCVLSLPGSDTHSMVNRFYSKAAQNTNEDIINPVCYDESLISHIPEDKRFRGYGCGSPVSDAALKTNENFVDLGSGTGIECFIAAKQVGAKGNITGIDMSEKMLSLAENTKLSVVENMGYANIEFKKAYLEKIPVSDNSVDAVVSNCVINLSPDKRTVFKEVLRILKPGGRLIVSDITYEEEIPLDIKYNETLRGECIGGALCYTDLFGILNDTGFSDSKILNGYKYREVKGYQFYSMTYIAYKPLADSPPVFHELKNFQTIMNEVEIEPACSCFITPEQNQTLASLQSLQTDKYKSGCMVCGEKLVYTKTDNHVTCYYCHQLKLSNAACENNHFVCDACHGADAAEVIKTVCLGTKEKDAVAIMDTIRSHPCFRIHGPEHHAMLPAVILAALRNNGNEITDEQILTAIKRGQAVPGGSCAFMGVCGAATGAGIAVSILLEATPYEGGNRQIAQQISHQVLGEIASYNAPRCCQRDCWTALKKLSSLLKEKMGKKLMLNDNMVCTQFKQNKECIYKECPFWPKQQTVPFFFKIKAN
jgi:MoaA/NifB/PqqE/SkfB family radical SAM enzyme/ubiquinone/menaquinone biosynthesis C-methylase UbiE